MDPNPADTVDLITRPDMPGPPVVAHPLPALGDTVEYLGHRYVVRDVTVSTKAFANPGQGVDRVSLSLRLMAWEGEAPFEDPANASMF